MNPALLAVLIQQVAVPELVAWFASRNGKTLTDADVIEKLARDTQIGEQIGRAWLVSHPPEAPTK